MLERHRASAGDASDPQLKYDLGEFMASVARTSSKPTLKEAFYSEQDSQSPPSRAASRRLDALDIIGTLNLHVHL